MRATTTQTSCAHSTLSTPPDTTCLATQSTLPATHPVRCNLPLTLLLKPQQSMSIPPQNSMPENVTTAESPKIVVPSIQGLHIATPSFHVKKKNIDALQDQLREIFSLPNPIPWSKVESVHENGQRYTNSLICFSFSNDFSFIHSNQAPNLDLCSTIGSIKAAPSLKKDQECCVAVVIGESALPAMLPALQKHCDLVLVLDCNPRLLKLVETGINFFKTTPTYVNSKKEYIESLIKEETRILEQAPDNPKNIDQKHDIQDRMHYLFDFRHKALGAYSPFYSKDSFDAVQRAAKTCPVIPVLCNIVTRSSMLNLQWVLQKNNAKITVANVTNALDNRLNNFSMLNNFSFEGGKPAPYKHFKRLPFSPDALCAYATHSDITPEKSYTACVHYNHFWHLIDHANFLQLTYIAQEQYLNASSPAEAVQDYKNKDFLSLAWLFIKHEPHEINPGFSHLACLISIGNIEEMTELHAFVQELREKGESIPAAEHQALQTLHAYLQDIARRGEKEEG